MILALALVRLVSFLLLLALAVLGLAVAVAAVNPGGVTELVGLPQLRDAVGGWFSDLAASGPIALASALGGAGAVLLGLVLLAGLLVPRRERLVRLASGDSGTISARRGPLAQIAGHLAEQVRGVTSSRTKVKSRRRGGGRLKVRVDRPRTAPPRAIKQAVAEQLENLAGPFKLKASVQTRLGEKGKRVQ